jgi:hypothetical protein
LYAGTTIDTLVRAGAIDLYPPLRGPTTPTLIGWHPAKERSKLQANSCRARELSVAGATPQQPGAARDTPDLDARLYLLVLTVRF